MNTKETLKDFQAAKDLLLESYNSEAAEVQERICRLNEMRQELLGVGIHVAALPVPKTLAQTAEQVEWVVRPVSAPVAPKPQAEAPQEATPKKYHYPAPKLPPAPKANSLGRALPNVRYNAVAPEILRCLQLKSPNKVVDIIKFCNQLGLVPLGDRTCTSAMCRRLVGEGYLSVYSMGYYSITAKGVERLKQLQKGNV